MHETARLIRELITDPEPASAAAVRTWAQPLHGIADRFHHHLPSRRAQQLTRGLVAAARAEELPPEALGEMIWAIADAMQMCPPHDWDCPIVSKVDPEHVTWTCRNCGAIAAGIGGQLPAASR